MSRALGSRLRGERYLASLGRDGEALAAASEGNLDARVPGCPGWDVADLVWHTGGVHHFWGSIARGALQDPEKVERPERPSRDRLITWYRDTLTATESALKTADPSAPVWTWTLEKDVAWIRRRMAQETAVHRWDAESATGRQRPIDVDIAVDGVDEYLEFFIQDALDEAGSSPDLSVHLHATDVEGEWIARTSNNRLEVRRAHEKGDAAVRAPASQLLLFLWGRIPESDVEVHGDRAALVAFLQLADLS
jgi:uncharacterized protein (TIGR03083 family)